MKAGQAAAEELKKVLIVKDGVCEALCMKWIKIRMRANVREQQKDASKEIAYQRMEKLASEKTFGKAIDRQHESKQVKFGSMENLETNYSIPGGMKSLNVQNGIHSVATIVSARRGSCFILGVRCLKYNDGAPAIAMYVDTNVLKPFYEKRKPVTHHIHLFDPNFGEFDLPSPDFPAFLLSLLYEAYEADDKCLNGLYQWA